VSSGKSDEAAVFVVQTMLVSGSIDSAADSRRRWRGRPQRQRPRCLAALQPYSRCMMSQNEVVTPVFLRHLNQIYKFIDFKREVDLLSGYASISSGPQNTTLFCQRGGSVCLTMAPCEGVLNGTCYTATPHIC